MSQPLIQRSWSWTVLWWPTRPSRTNNQARCLFIIGDWNAKVIQEIPGVTGKFGLEIQNEAGQSPTKIHQENTLVIANTLIQQEKTLHTDITTWSISKSDWLYYLHPKMKKLYTVSKTKTWNWLWLRSSTPYCNFRLQLKKVGKITRPFS